MCNRYRAATDIEKLRTVIGGIPDDWFDETDKTYSTSYPKKLVPVILMVEGQLRYMNFMWGVHAQWMKAPSETLHNTRVESVLAKPTWKNAFMRRRCLMPAEAFFEPLKVGGVTRNVRFDLKSEEPFMIAGIWEKFEYKGVPTNGCSMMIGEPNSMVAEVHTRMPAILHNKDILDYLSIPPEHSELAREMLVTPFPAELMQGNVDSEST